MIEVAIVDPGFGAAINTTLPDTDDPNYQQACLSLFFRQQFDALRNDDVEFQFAESTDFSTFNTDLLDGVDDFEERLDEILANGVSSVVAVLPDVTPIIAALLAGGGGAVIPILLKGVMDVMLRHMNSRTTAAQGDFSEGVDSAGIITALEEIKDQMDAVLTEFNINLHDDMEQSSWSVGPVAE